jgi:hypothetical protein
MLHGNVRLVRRILLALFARIALKRAIIRAIKFG